MDGWINDWMDNKKLYELKNDSMNEWMDDWINEWINAWMDKD